MMSTGRSIPKLGLDPSALSITGLSLREDGADERLGPPELGWEVLGMDLGGEGAEGSLIEAEIFDPVGRRPTLYEELASMGELMETDDEGWLTGKGSWAEEGEYASPPPIEHRDSVEFHRARLVRVQERTAVGALVGSDGGVEYDDTDEDDWFDAEDGWDRAGLVNDSSEGSMDGTVFSNVASCSSSSSSPPPSTSAASFSERSDPPWNHYACQPSIVPRPLKTRDGVPSPLEVEAAHNVRKVVFSTQVRRYAGELGNVQLISVSALPTAPCTYQTPRITLTPPTPRQSAFERVRLHPRTDTKRLFVREGDRYLKGRTERTKRAVDERRAIVKRRRGRFRYALAKKVGTVEALRMVNEQTKCWDEWARSGK